MAGRRETLKNQNAQQSGTTAEEHAAGGGSAMTDASSAQSDQASGAPDDPGPRDDQGQDRSNNGATSPDGAGAPPPTSNAGPDGDNAPPANNAGSDGDGTPPANNAGSGEDNTPPANQAGSDESPDDEAPGSGADAGGADSDDTPITGIADFDGLLGQVPELIGSLSENPAGALGLDLGSLGLGGVGGTVHGVLDTAMPAVGTVAGSVETLVGSLVQSAGNAAGLSDTASAVNSIIDSLGIDDIGSHGGNGVVADIVNLPHDVLTGGNPVGLVANILQDASVTIDELPGLTTALLSDLGSPLVNADAAGDGDSSGSNIVNAGVGPQQDNGILLDVLTSNGSGSGDTANINALNGPQLVNADVLNGSDSIALPTLGGAGLDSLNGLLDGTSTPDASGSANVTATLDVVDDVVAALDVDGLLDVGPVQTSSQHQSSLIQGLV